MLEDEQKLRKITDRLVADMIAANVAQKKFYTDQRLGQEYWLLSTPNALDKDLIAVAILGYPEQVGVWSYTLLKQSRTAESSMEPYFREFQSNNLGLVAINPNIFEPDIKGDTFHYQLDRAIADVPPEKKIGLIVFSMGGRIVIEFLEQRPELIDRIAGLVLIDPTLPNRLRLKNIRPLLDTNTLLIASEADPQSPGRIASVLLDIPNISFPGIHGQMPNKALPDIVKFFSKRAQTQNT
jgi:hypothetical protein